MNIKIGHVELTVDPTQISVDQISHISQAEGLRSIAAQASPTGYSEFRVMMSVLFSDADDINYKLRPIIALSKASPFTMIQSETVSDSIITGTEITPQPRDRDRSLSSAYWKELIDQLYAEWAVLIYQYYVAPRVKAIVSENNFNAYEILTEALGLQFDQFLGSINKARNATPNLANEIGKRIAALKWHWNYCLIVGQADEGPHSKEDVELLLSEGNPDSPAISDLDLTTEPRYVIPEAYVTKVLDGDTVRVLIPGGKTLGATPFSGTQEIAVRMAGYDAFETVQANGKLPQVGVPEPQVFKRGQESHGTTHVAYEQATDFGLACKDWLDMAVFTGNVDPSTGNHPVRVDVYQNDVFGRVVARVVPKYGAYANKSVNHEILRLGLAVPPVVQPGPDSVLDISYLEAAKYAADNKIGLWNDSLWGGYVFEVSALNKSYPHESIATGIDNLQPKVTRGIVLPSEFRSRGRNDQPSILMGRRLYNGQPGKRLSGHALEGETDYDFEWSGDTPVDTIASINNIADTEERAEKVGILYWDFNSKVKRYMPEAELKPILDERVVRVSAETEFRLQGPTHLFRTTVDSLVGLARQDEQDDRVSYSRLQSQHFPGDWIPVCFDMIRVESVENLPDTVQATFAFTFFNHAPYVPIFGYIGSRLDNENRLLTDPQVLEIDPLRSLTFMRYLEDRYLTDTYDNRFQGRYISPYSKLTNEILIEYKAKRLAEDRELTSNIHGQVVQSDPIIVNEVETHRALLSDEPIGRAALDYYQISIPNTVIDTIVVDYVNHLPKLPLEGVEYPTAQFTGRGQGKATLKLRTDDRGALRALYHMWSKTKESARMASSQHLKDTVIKLTHPMINITGMYSFVIANMQQTSVPELPGWYDVVIDMVESAPRYLPREELTPVKVERTDAGVASQMVDLLIDQLLVGPPDIRANLISRLIGPVGQDGIMTENKRVSINSIGPDSDFVVDWAKSEIAAAFTEDGDAGGRPYVTNRIFPGFSPLLVNLLPYLYVTGLDPQFKNGFITENGSAWLKSIAATDALGDETFESELIPQLVPEWTYEEQKAVWKWISRNWFDEREFRNLFGHYYLPEFVELYEHQIGTGGVLGIGPGVIDSQQNRAKSFQKRVEYVARLQTHSFAWGKDKFVPEARAVFLGPPRYDWHHQILTALQSYTYNDFCVAVGQDPNNTYISPAYRTDDSLDAATEEAENRLFWKDNKLTGPMRVHPNWIELSWHLFSRSVAALNKPTTRLVEQVRAFEDPDIRLVLKFFLTIGVRFPSYRAYLFGIMAEILPHLSDQLDSRVLQSKEPVLYEDLDLPTYIEIFGRTHIPNIVLREELYILITRFSKTLRLSGDDAPDLDRLHGQPLSQIKPPETDDPSRWLDRMVDYMRFSGSGLKKPTNVPSDLFYSATVYSWLDGDEISQSDRTQLLYMAIRIAEMINSLRDSYSIELRVPDDAKPTFRDFGIRGPHASNPKAHARQDFDVVEPGWFYYHPKINVWGVVEDGVEDGAAMAEDWFGIRPESEESKYRTETLYQNKEEDVPGYYWDKAVSDVTTSDGQFSRTRFGNITNYPSRMFEIDGEKTGTAAADKAQRKEQARQLSYVENDPTNVANTTYIENQAKDSGQPKEGSVMAGAPKGMAVSPAYSGRFGSRIEQTKLMRMAAASKPKYPHDMRMAFPTYALYFVEEDKEEWGFFDDYYRYDSIVSIEIIQDKKQTDLAVITLTNMSGVLSNKFDEEKANTKAGPIIRSDDTTRTASPYEDQDRVGGKAGDFFDRDENQLLAFKIKQGTRIVIKLGYSTQAADLPTVFTGQVAEVMGGPVITIVCQAYDYQLTESLYEKWSKAQRSFPEIIQDMLSNVNYFGGYRFFADRLEAQTKTRGRNERGRSRLEVKKYLETSMGDNLYVDRASWWGELGWRIWGDDWICAGPMLENMFTMPRYLPGQVMHVRPYDARATLYFGPPEGAYLFTSHASTYLMLWAGRRDAYSRMISSGLYKPMEKTLGYGEYWVERKKNIYSGGEAENTEAGSVPELEYDIVRTENKYFSSTGGGYPNLVYTLPDSAPGYIRPQDGDFIVIDRLVNDYYDWNDKYGVGVNNTRIQMLKDRISEVPDDIVAALFNDLVIWTGEMGKAMETLRLITTTYEVDINDVQNRDYGVTSFASYFMDPNAENITMDRLIDRWNGAALHATGIDKYTIITATSDYQAALAIAKRTRVGPDGVFLRINKNSLQDVANPGAVIKEFLHRLIDAINYTASWSQLTVMYRILSQEQKSWLCTSVAFELGREDKPITSMGQLKLQSLSKGGRVGRAQVRDTSGNWLIWNALIGAFIPYLVEMPDYVSNNPDSEIAQTYRAVKSVETTHLPPNMAPFRDHHMITSGQNMISNQIKASRSHMGNVAIVESPAGIPKIKSDGNNKEVKLPDKQYVHRASITHEDDLVYPIPSHFKDINAYHNGVCWQVAMSCLGEAVREMYQGQVVILGNPQIKPYDMVTLQDYQNMMNGTFEVNRVVHHFSHDTGYITTVHPHLIVHVNKDTDYWKSVAVTAAFTVGTFAVAAATFAVGGPLWLAALGVGAGAAASKLGGGSTKQFLGFQFPWISGQAKIGPARNNPVRLSPMTYKGKPYTAGLEGWEKYAYDPNQGAFGSYAENFGRTIELAEEGASAAARNFNRYWSQFWNTTTFAIENTRQLELVPRGVDTGRAGPRRD